MIRQILADLTHAIARDALTKENAALRARVENVSEENAALHRRLADAQAASVKAIEDAENAQAERDRAVNTTVGRVDRDKAIEVADTALFHNWMAGRREKATAVVDALLAQTSATPPVAPAGDTTPSVPGASAPTINRDKAIEAGRRWLIGRQEPWGTGVLVVFVDTVLEAAAGAPALAKVIADRAPTGDLFPTPTDDQIEEWAKAGEDSYQTVQQVDYTWAEHTELSKKACRAFALAVFDAIRSSAPKKHTPGNGRTPEELDEITLRIWNAYLGNPPRAQHHHTLESAKRGIFWPLWRGPVLDEILKIFEGGK